ncbi:MNIO family bufferin maturase [Duganella caerulea]|uniref:MNIO family bufferin maturase n=1 Tax=Duganella caerulea TaxID=2885762 RepID=UPI004037B167
MTSTLPSPGYGLGLRPAHYTDIIATPPAATGIDWFEILSENYMVPGGKPLAMLDRIRRDYPMVMHGVSMSIGTPQGPSDDYLRELKKLVRRVEPLWVSDHLCWTGTHGTNMHDLFPLPYTEEAVAIVVRNVRRVQDYLERPLLLENVSSYLSFEADTLQEWDFVAAVAEESDSLILLDVNNVYVSSVNHGFNPITYLDALPARRVQQIHLAGHSVQEGCIIDTHDQAVADPVWALYAQALRRFGKVATMIERDDHIPPLSELSAELQRARALAESL